MQPHLFIGQLIGFAILLVIRQIVVSQKDLDPAAKAKFAQIMVLNMLMSIFSAFFYGQNASDRSMGIIPKPHDYSKLAIFGLDTHDWTQIALGKFLVSNLVVLAIGIPLYGLNFALMRHYAISRPTVRAVWITVGVMLIYLLASAFGDYQFVTRRL